jgi:hypothetical protein
MSSIVSQFDVSATTLAAAQANVQASSLAQAALLNENLKTIYLSAFHDWTISVVAGRIDNANPPKPPAGWVVVPVEDPTWPGVFWDFPQKSGPPVCEMPPVPDDCSKPKPKPIAPPGNLMNVPPGDNMPVGYIATAPDGAQWQKQASATPFGIAYYYVRIA